MGRSKKRKRNAELSRKLKQDENSVKNKDLPFAKLTTEYILMRVNNGTKMENVMKYALDKFPNYKCIIWTGIGQAVYKTISCSEIFKIKHPGLHQINKLRYVVSRNKNKTEGDRQVPQIYILLSKEPLDTTELGYQAPGDSGEFKLQGNDNSTEPDSTDLDLDKSNILKDDDNDSVINIDSEISSIHLKFEKRPSENQMTPLNRKRKKLQ
ncbi:hypothetical protein M0802_007606 [Mischocyttarus mexicanus]|nr:hypothetical protein M0802_007606 [Mischocyttarus mexicanus]